MLKFLRRNFYLSLALSLLFNASSALGPENTQAATVHARAQAKRHPRDSRRGRDKAPAVRAPDASQATNAPAGTVLLGGAGVGPVYVVLGAGRAEAVRIQAHASGVAGVVHIYLSPQNTARVVIVGLYAGAGNHPGSLVSTGSVAVSGSGGWTAVPIAPVTLALGTKYWLAVLGEDGGLGFRDREREPCLNAIATEQGLLGLPSSWTTGAVRSGCPMSAYASVASESSPTEVDEQREAAESEESPGEASPPEEEPNLLGEAPVTDTVAPEIAGRPVVGQMLEASPGVWSDGANVYAYQWEGCGPSGEACSEIAGATGSSYELAGRDIGHTLRVVVTASNADGASSASSAPTGLVVEAPTQAPTNTAPPTVGGVAEEGRTLSASAGSWSGSPTSYGYQWEDCNTAGEACSAIAGATGSGYELAAGDVGHTLRVVVRASNAGGSTAASSAATATVVPVAPANTVLPVVSGSVVEGDALSASAGSWSGSPTSYGYQWEDCNTAGEACSAIAGATGSGYELAAGDVGHTLRVVVRASNAGGSTAASSAATATVVPVAPANTVLPVVSGSVVEGDALSASAGSWSGSPTSYGYQWEDCNTAGEACSAIAGATGSGYELAAGDVGHTLRVVVRASNAGGSTAASSAATATVVPVAPANTVLPVVSGSVVEGDALSASAGSWSGSPTSYGYQWEDCNTAGEACSAIAGATGSGYELAAGDVGHTLRVVVRASNAGGSTAASSAATATVVPVAPANTVLPVVSGSVVEGDALSASAGSWSGSPTSYGYQWEDCNTAGEACSAIAGATGSGYELAAGDVGHTLRVVVRASNAGGSTAASSAATATVVPVAPANTVLPVVSIPAEDGVVRSPEEGMTLSASAGTWSGAPTSYGYQWEDCNTAGEGCSVIGGATGSTYELAGGDVGHTVRVVVTASNAGGSAQASSASSAAVRVARWYASSSLWNTPIAADPAIAPENASLIAQWSETSTCEGESGEYCMSTLVEWTPSVWYATPSTPMVEVQIDAPTCDARSVQAPIPAGALPDASDEGHMMVLGSNGTEYDFFQAQAPDQTPKSHYAGDDGTCPTVDAWTAGEMTVGNWRTGSGSGYGVRGSETPEGAGLITQQDLEMPAGSTWPHALAVTYGPTCSKTLSWCGAVLPATNNDGWCVVQSRCLPEGARLQLDPSIDCSTWPSIKYEWQRQWCRTWQTYGVIIVDSKGSGMAGGAVQYSQNPVSWSKGFKPPWDSDPEIPANAEGEKVGVMPSNLLSHFRVLAW